MKSSSGFSLIEILVYISILVLVSGGALTLLFSLSDRVTEGRATQLVTNNAESALERMLLDIRNAESIDTFYSALETSPGELMVVKGATTSRFFIAGDSLMLEINGAEPIPLTNEKVSVDSLRFFAYDNTATQMVRAVMTLHATVGEATVTKTFNAGATLRGSYE